VPEKQAPEKVGATLRDFGSKAARPPAKPNHQPSAIKSEEMVMFIKEVGKAGCASLMTAAMLVQPFAAFASDAKADQAAIAKKTFTVAPRSSDLVAKYTSNPDTEVSLTEVQKIALLQKNVKYVFVLFQENRSFDFYFGTYPGAFGLYGPQHLGETPGYYQPIVNQDGGVSTITPYLIPQTTTDTSGNTVELYPEDTDSVNHAHSAIDAKLDLTASNVALNDRYAFTEEGLTGTLTPYEKELVYKGPAPTLAQKQKGELVMGHVDCNTAPFLWTYADHFTLMDNFFDTVIGPSTPNAIAMIAGQSGTTQWVEHPELASNNFPTTYGGGVPVTSDPQPYWGSALDTLTPAADQQPVDNPGGVSANPSSNLTFATLPLTFMGNGIQAITAGDNNPVFDLQDVQEDITKIAGETYTPVNWGWYQEGYDKEPTDPANAPASALHTDYIAHHNAPQYFGYEANNPGETQKHMKGLGDFYTAIKNKALPATGGVFYVRGGYGNLDGLTPRSPSPAVEANFPGNDDHPGYSDAQISEALLADSINAIASSPYWSQSAIIITYDETDGLYDHAQPSIRNFDPFGAALEQGPRIPAIVISPYGNVHVISHEPSEHSSVIKFIDVLFNLPRMADLPNEAAARALGEVKYKQKYLEPGDGVDNETGELLSAFDNNRLSGITPPLPASFAMIPTEQITSLPHFGGQGCRSLQINPTDIVNGVVIDPAPADFNPRPGTNPGLPTTPGWPTN
jgi:phospholipase C